MKVWTKSIKLDVVVVAENRQRAEAAIIQALVDEVREPEKEEEEVKHVVSESDLPPGYDFDCRPKNGDGRVIGDYISSADVMKESLR